MEKGSCRCAAASCSRLRFKLKDGGLTPEQTAVRRLLSPAPHPHADTRSGKSVSPFKHFGVLLCEAGRDGNGELGKGLETAQLAEILMRQGN